MATMERRPATWLVFAAWKHAAIIRRVHRWVNLSALLDLKAGLAGQAIAAALQLSAVQRSYRKSLPAGKRFYLILSKPRTIRMLHGSKKWPPRMNWPTIHGNLGCSSRAVALCRDQPQSS